VIDPVPVIEPTHLGDAVRGMDAQSSAVDGAPEHNTERAPRRSYGSSAT